MKNRWAMLLAVLLIPVWATAQNAANSSFQIKGILLDSLTKEGEPYATIKIVKKERAGTCVENAGDGYEGTLPGESTR